MMRRRYLVPLLLTITYAVFGGLSVHWFHVSLSEYLHGFPRALAWVPVIDGLYLVCTVVLAGLLLTHLWRLIRQYERRLEESEDRFRALVEATSDFVWEIDAEFAYRFVSPGVESMLGYAPDELLGRSPLALMTSEGRRVAKDFLYRIAESQRVYQQVELEYRHRDGHVVTVLTSGMPVLAKDGTLRGYRGIDRDISQRRRVEKAMYHSHLFYRNMFDGFPLPIWRADHHGRIIYLNTAGERYFGSTAAEEISERLGRIHPDDLSTYEYTYMKATAAHRPFKIGYRLQRCDGDYCDVVQAGVPLYDHQGVFVGYFGYCITQEEVEPEPEALSFHEMIDCNLFTH